MEPDGPMSHLLSCLCRSKNSQGSQVLHNSTILNIVRCGLDQSGPKSTWRCHGPNFSQLPYKVYSPVFLIELGQRERKT